MNMVKTTLSCPKCDYETPVRYEVGDAWCYTCECRVPSHLVKYCQRDECELDIMSEDDVLKEAEFWLYENHPDNCPNGFTGDEESIDWVEAFEREEE